VVVDHITEEVLAIGLAIDEELLQELELGRKMAMPNIILAMDGSGPIVGLQKRK